MAINKSTRYDGRWEVASEDYPMGKPKNRTSETAKDGTYFEKDWLIDYEAFFGALMNNANFSPNGVSDTAQDGQFYDALEKVIYENSISASDGGGELTQDFDELQEVIDKSVGVSGNGGNLTQSLNQVQTILNNAVETTTTTLFSGSIDSGDSASLSESIRNFHMISVVLGDNSEDSDVKTIPTDAINSGLAVTSYVIDASEGDTQATQFSFTNNTTIKSLRTFRDNRLQPDGSVNHTIRKVYGITRL